MLGGHDRSHPENFTCKSHSERENSETEGGSRVVGEESKAQQLTGTEGKMWWWWG